MTLAFIFIMHFSRQEMLDITKREAEAAGVPYVLAYRLVQNECDFNNDAIGYNYDKKTGELLSVDLYAGQQNSLYMAWKIKRYLPEMKGKEVNLHDPNINLRMSFRQLRSLRDYLGNWEDAVRGYNGGTGCVITDNVKEKTEAYMWRIIADFGQREKWEYGISL